MSGERKPIEGLRSPRVGVGRISLFWADGGQSEVGTGRKVA